MRFRNFQRLCWWALVAFIVFGLLLTFALNRNYSAEKLLTIPFVGYALVGAVVAARRPENPIGWIFLTIGLLISLASLGSVGVDATLAAGPPATWWGVFSTWYDHVFWFPIIMLATTFTFLLFPDGLSSPRWRPLRRLAIVSTVLGTAVLAVAPTLDVDHLGVRSNGFMIHNPVALPFVSNSYDLASSWWFLLPAFLGLLCAVAAIGSAVMRFLRSSGVERQQMQLFALAIVLVPISIPFPFYIAFAAALTFIPVACGLAILRYRLYEIDRIVARTTAYGLVTAVLLTVYFTVVTSVTQLLPASNDLAVAAATLTAAAVFRPLLRRVQRLVDRRFNREQYDAERSVEQFAGRLRDEVGSDEVSDDLLAMLDRTVQPAAAGLWLREPSS